MASLSNTNLLAVNVKYELSKKIKDYSTEKDRGTSDLPFILLDRLSAGIHDPANRADPHAAVAQVFGAPVLSWTQVQHPASVVGLLVH